MKLENLFTAEELTLIDSGEYRPRREVLDAKLDLCAAIEREACAKVCDENAQKALNAQKVIDSDDLSDVFLRHHASAHFQSAKEIRSRGEA